ncbi:MAG: hypothetical protein Ta2G_11370 [Termitinemataceae bacterium]|nr:MAG: hypothetical protein Ta2G_11370 [Termitinemataceae bacterium]
MKKNIVFFVILFLFCTVSLSALLDFADGRIKVTIDEKLGRFSLYYMTDVDKKTYEPLFWVKDKRTSFLSVAVDNREYTLGETGTFKTMVRGTDKRPSLSYESPFLSITEEFSFIRSASSGVSNGVRIDITVENWGEDKKSVGVRMLLDTFLGEKTNPNFRTDVRSVNSELIIDKSTTDQYWVSRNKDYGIMGSIFVPGVDSPDFLHFANWKRLKDARFEAEYISSRNFSVLPFSGKDSAVCYYMNLKPMKQWEKRTMTILLAAEDQYGFDIPKMSPGTVVEYYNLGPNAPEKQIITNSPTVPVITQQQQQQQQAAAPAIIAPVEPSRKRPTTVLPPGSMRLDLMTLRELIYKVDSYVYSGNKISEAELKAMESAITVLKARYGSVFTTY